MKQNPWKLSDEDRAEVLRDVLADHEARKHSGPTRLDQIEAKLFAMYEPALGTEDAAFVVAAWRDFLATCEGHAHLQSRRAAGAAPTLTSISVATPTTAERLG